MRHVPLIFGLAVLSIVPAGAATLQEQYVAAQAAFDAGRMAEARAGFAAVLPRLDGNPKMKVQAAIVRSRMGAAATAIAEPEAAMALIAVALVNLAPASTEWIVAQLDLGLAAELAIDYDTAAHAYRAALASAQPDDGAALSAKVGLARVLTFSDPAAARTYADAALGAVERQQATAPMRAQYAQLLALRGRIDLNDGKPAAARPWFDKAAASGRALTSSKVSIADVRIRGDLAIASFQSGDLDAARKYLAHTGSGQLQSKGFKLGSETPLPQCAPVGALSRNDMAIVEFSIDDDGRVTSVSTIFATRPAAAVEFARAVRDWSWNAAEAQAIDRFWRQAVRLEIRCADGTAATDRRKFDPGTEVTRWLAENSPEPLPALPPTAATELLALRSELARRIALFGGTSLQLLPVLLMIERNPSRTRNEASVSLATALKIAEGQPSPRDLSTFIRSRQVETDAPDLSSGPAQAAVNIRRFEALSNALDAAGAGQTRGAAMVAARIAFWASYSKDQSRMIAAFRRILAFPFSSLPDGDLLRQATRIQLASVEAQAQNLEVARSLIAATGLTPEQCSTVVVTPIATRLRVNEIDFPKEALRWGFEGSVRVAFDIDSAGIPTGVRTVIASPPLVFNEGAEKVYRASRYQPIFGGGGNVGCAGQQKSINFSIQR